MTKQAEKPVFDCIAVKQEAQGQIYEEIKDLTPSQEIDYFRKAVRGSRFKELWESASASNTERFDEVS